MKDSKIEWTDHTFNPWRGCSKVSPGCAHCYAEALTKRFGKDFKVRTRMSEGYWKQPLAWNRKCEKTGTRAKVFCCSMADWLDEAVPIEWLADLLDLVRQTPHLDWLLLTKRPQNWKERISAACDNLMARNIEHSWLFQWVIFGEVPRNVWPGATVENQEMADIRIDQLRSIPAVVRFLSCEPLLGHVDLGLEVDEQWCCPSCKKRDESGPVEDYTECGLYLTCSNCGEYAPQGEWGSRSQIDWVICGGESGKEARPMHPDWARSLRDQCKAAGVPFLFKQWGEWAPHSEPAIPGKNNGAGAYVSQEGKLVSQGEYWAGRAAGMNKTGKKASGRLLDGVEHHEFPG